MLIGSIVAFLLAGVTTWWGIRWFLERARRWALIDMPNERSSHAIPTPRGGGLFFFPVLSLCALAAFQWQPTELSTGWLFYSLFCAAGLTFLGFRDDISSLPSYLRLGIQFALVLPLVFLGPDWSALSLPLLPTIEWGPGFGKFMLVIWFVGMINVYNFMDGIDGIAALQGVAASLGGLALSLIYDSPLLTLISVSALGMLGGFLLFNWQPAKIFMGDVGSNFLGFLFAWFPLALAGLPKVQEAGDASLIFASFCLFLAPFMLDGGFTLVRRLLKGENVFAAHRSHLYQRLTQQGHSHGQVALLYLGWAMISLIVVLVGILIQQPALIYLSLAIALVIGFLIFRRTCRSN